jgi:hypothetical protein
LQPDHHKVCQVEQQKCTRVNTSKHLLADAQTNKRNRLPHMKIKTYIHIISFHPPKEMYIDFIEHLKDWRFIYFEDPTIPFLPHYPDTAEPKELQIKTANSNIPNGQTEQWTWSFGYADQQSMPIYIFLLYRSSNCRSIYIFFLER